MKNRLVFTITITAFLVGIMGSSFVNNALAATVNTPNPPTLNNVNVINATEITLHWTPSAGTHTGFAIQRSWDNLANSTWVTVTTIIGNTNNMTFYHLIPNTLYNYRVITINSGIPSSPSNVVGNTTTTVIFDGTHTFITIGFDHAFQTQINATQWMKKNYGLVGVTWIPTNRTINPLHLANWYNVTRYFNETKGWEVVPHSRNHELIPYSEFGNGKPGFGMPNATKYGGYDQSYLQGEIVGSFVDMANSTLHKEYNYPSPCGYVPPSNWKYNATTDKIITSIWMSGGETVGHAKWTTQNAINQYTNTTNIITSNGTKSIGMVVFNTIDISDLSTGFKPLITNYKNVIGNITAAYPNACYLDYTHKMSCNRGHAQWIFLHVHDILNSRTNPKGFEVPISSTLFDKTMSAISSLINNGTVIYENPSSGLGNWTTNTHIHPFNGQVCK